MRVKLEGRCGVYICVYVLFCTESDEEEEGEGLCAIHSMVSPSKGVV